MEAGRFRQGLRLLQILLTISGRREARVAAYLGEPRCPVPLGVGLRRSGLSSRVPVASIRCGPGLRPVGQPASLWVTGGSPIHSRRVFFSLVCWMNRSCSGSAGPAAWGAFR